MSIKILVDFERFWVNDLVKVSDMMLKLLGTIKNIVSISAVVPVMGQFSLTLYAALTTTKWSKGWSYYDFDSKNYLFNFTFQPPGSGNCPIIGTKPDIPYTHKLENLSVSCIRDRPLIFFGRGMVQISANIFEPTFVLMHGGLIGIAFCLYSVTGCCYPANKTEPIQAIDSLLTTYNAKILIAGCQ